jgi:cyclase
MLKYRIIPTLLLKDGRMVKSRQFGDYRDVGDPVTAARVYDAQRADELMFLDISASQEGRGVLFDIIKQVSAECFMPLGVGGGIRSIEDIRALLKASADKVVINTAAYEIPGFIREAAGFFGSSTIVVSIDVRDTPLLSSPIRGGRRGMVYIRGGIVDTGEDPIHYAKKMEQEGAGEIMLTSIDRDGMMNGYDIDLIRSVADAVSIPLIASGGVGSLEDLKKGIEEGASAVAAASIFHFTDQSPIKARKYLFDRGIPVRA